MKRVWIALIALMSVAGAAYAAGCCEPGADCCAKACCKKSAR